MKATALRLTLALAVTATAGCASAGRAIGGAELERSVLANAGATKLAAALATDLMNRPADDPVRFSPQIAGLRGVLDAPAMVTVTAVQTKKGAAPSLQSFAMLTPAAPQSITAPAALATIPALAVAEAPAPAPKKQVFAVALGRFDDAAIAASVWNELASADALAVKGLAPRLASSKLGLTLLAGPLEDEDTALGRCTAFRALGVECAPTQYQGKALSEAGT